jgi:hypothetical protein
MSLAALRAIWLERVGPLPRLRSPELIRQLLVWRNQAEAWGDLDVELRNGWE